MFPITKYFSQEETPFTGIETSDLATTRQLTRVTSRYNAFGSPTASGTWSGAPLQ